MDKIGDFAATSWISGLCAYRAACVAILQGRTSKAIGEAETAVAIGRSCKAPVGVRARSTHILSKALSMDPNRRTDEKDARQQAQQLRKLLPPGQTDLGDESDHAYEMLVNIISR